MAGRPRSSDIDEAIAAAVRELLLDGGYPAASIEGVARRAGVTKPTVYRRWPTKAEMVFAVAIHPESIAPPADTGRLRGDLVALAERVLEIIGSPLARAALPGLLAEPSGTARINASFIDAERAVLAEIVERAIARREIARSASVDDAHAFLLGTAFAWVFLIDEPGRAALAERIADGVVGALGGGASR